MIFRVTMAVLGYCLLTWQIVALVTRVGGNWFSLACFFVGACVSVHQLIKYTGK